MAIATGQITLIDLNDEVSLQGFLTSSQPKVQFMNTGGSRNPDWAGNKPVITAEIFRMGTANNIITDTTLIKNVRWYYKDNGTTYTLVASDNSNFTISSNKSNLTINTNIMGNNKPSLSIRCEIDYQHNSVFPVNTYKLDFEYYLSIQGATGNTGSTGATGVTALLTNENISIGCNSNGSPNAGWEDKTISEIIVYQGSTKLTEVADTATPNSNQFKYVINSGTGCTGVRVNNKSFKLSSITADTGTLQITITAGSQTVTKVFSFTKVKAGVDGTNGNNGTNAKSVDLTATSQIIKFDESKNPNPAIITLTATKTHISSNTFSWYSSTDGVNFTAISGQTSSTLAVAHNASYFGGNSVTIKVAIDGVFDIITLSKISDGVNPVVAYAWAPLGTTFKNSNATDFLKAEMIMTKGTSPAEGSYQWYYQDSLGTDDSADVGNGWKKCVDKANDFSGSATKTLTLYASRVLGVETFKCRAIYGGRKYYDTVTFVDQTDPYQVELISTAGNIFKNGVGSTQVTCRLYQNGEVIDENGTGFTYNWLKYDKNGSLQSPNPWKQGKTITITAKDVVEKANFVCEVVKK